MRVWLDLASTRVAGDNSFPHGSLNRFLISQLFSRALGEAECLPSDHRLALLHKDLSRC
jgi:hypothetical protein